MPEIRYRAADVGGVKISYREAGPQEAPEFLMLHGFPTAGHMFRDLIPLLADRFHLIAPDLPGFGQSDLPPRQTFKYTFENLAETIGHFTETVGLKRFAIYIFDYGAPVGMRIALNHPERITAIVSQNGNAYEEGLSEAWNPIRTTGVSPARRTEMPYGVSCPPKPRFFNTPTALQIPPPFHLMAARWMIII